MMMKKRKFTKKSTFPHVKNPHNDLFLLIFSRRDKAIALLTKCLPAIILAVVDLDKLERIESKHTSVLGVTRYGDIIYRCPLKNNKPGYYYFQIEHQSTPDARMPLRCLIYTIDTVEGHLEQGYETFPIVITLVFYTGRRKWKYSVSFSDNYDDPATSSQYLHFAKLLLLTVPTNKEHSDFIDPELGYCYVAFHCGRKRKKAYEEFEQFRQIPAFNNYFDKLPANERLLAATYIGIFSESIEELERIIILVTTNEKEKQKFMKTIYQTLRQEGWEGGLEKGLEKGLERGRHEGIEYVAHNMLRSNMDIDTVQKLTELPKKELQRIVKNS